MSVDRIVFVGACAVLSFVIGMGVGEDKARDQIATVCEPQPGSTLASVVQDRAGITCHYVANIYGRAAKPRRPARKTL